jgi:hypothetical protein
LTPRLRIAASAPRFASIPRRTSDLVRTRRAGRSESAQGHLNDLLGERLVKRLTGDQEAVEQRAAEKNVERQLEIGVRGDVTASHAAPQNPFQGVSTSAQEATSHSIRKLSVSLHGRNDGWHRGCRHRTRVEIDGVAHQRQQIVSRRTGVGNRYRFGASE